MKKSKKAKKIKEKKPKKMLKSEMNEYKKLLLLQKKEVFEELTKNLDNGKKIDFNEVKDSVDLASDTYDTEFLHNLSDTEKRSIEEIDYALEKIEKGAYGNCEICGKKINKERLKALPSAKYCILCQTKRER